MLLTFRYARAIMRMPSSAEFGGTKRAPRKRLFGKNLVRAFILSLYQKNILMSNNEEIGCKGEFFLWLFLKP